MKSIVIASRYKSVNRSLENTICLIKKGWTITTVTDEAALAGILKKEVPNILLIDAHFAKCASAYVVALLHRRYRDMRIAIFELQERNEFDASRFILSGAESYFSRRGASELYHRELALMLDGETYIPEYIRYEVDEAGLPPDSFKFGKRQRKILELLSEGKSYKEITKRLRVRIKRFGIMFRRCTRRPEFRRLREMLNCCYSRSTGGSLTTDGLMSYFLTVKTVCRGMKNEE